MTTKAGTGRRARVTRAAAIVLGLLALLGAGTASAGAAAATTAAPFHADNPFFFD